MSTVFFLVQTFSDHHHGSHCARSEFDDELAALHHKTIPSLRSFASEAGFNLEVCNRVTPPKHTFLARDASAN